VGPADYLPLQPLQNAAHRKATLHGVQASKTQE
jgi:hypothetical protein